MGKRTANLSCTEWFLSIFAVVILGLAAAVTPASPSLASTTSMSPMPSARIPPTSAAAPCSDKTMRYVDCGNGTVTDTATGLIWLKQSNCFPSSDWDDAKKAAAGLKNGDCGLTDGSSPGDWRLPTIAEWEATIVKAKDLKCAGPVLTNDTGTACIAAGPSSFTGVEADYFWSSTMDGSTVSFGDLDHGNLLKGNSINSLRVWPVRGGQR